jgi:hypothetical protein
MTGMGAERGPGLTAGAVLAGALLCAALLVAPGQTVISVYANDLFIFLDGAWRVASGQVPNRDFHTALGPLVYLLPAAGYRLTGSLGLAMPVAMALVLAIMVPPMAWILASRVRPLLAIPFAAFLLLVVAVPMNLGEAVSALSFAMFYNRVGWAGLALLVVMALPPGRAGPGRVAADALSAAVLAGLMLATKITYGAVALGFLALFLLDAGHRRWALAALAVVAGAGLAAEAAWGIAAAHVADLSLAGAVSGGLRGGVLVVADAALRNLADLVLFGLLAGLALRRAPSWHDALLYAACVVSGLLVMVQNSQGWGVLTLHGGALVAAERIMRADPPSPMERRPVLAAGTPLFVLALLLPTIVHCATALGLHAWLASERPVGRYALPGYDRIRIAQLWPVDDHGFSTAFRDGLAEGAAAMADLDPRRIVVLDFVNAFSAGLGVAPPRGDSSWLHWGRNVNERHHIPPERLLGDARIVLRARPGINGDALWAVYGSYVSEHFTLARETPAWEVYRRREDPAQASADP